MSRFIIYLIVPLECKIKITYLACSSHADLHNLLAKKQILVFFIHGFCPYLQLPLPVLPY